MNDLAELFARDPLSINAEGKVGYTEAELTTLIAYYRDLRIKNLLGVKKPSAPTKAVSLDDLDV